jgi:hypothetical protein
MKVTRRNFIHRAMGSTMATALSADYVVGQDGQSGSAATPSAGSAGRTAKQVPLSADEAKAMGKVTLLFVQNAQGAAISNGKMTLKKISPTTIFFSDRPERIAGHLTTKEFVPFWSEGTDSFAANPPNATLSALEEGKLSDVVLELRNPKLAGDELSYEVKILEGALGGQGGACSLFIDVIGMPLTPFSYAGAARRAYRWR